MKHLITKLMEQKNLNGQNSVATSALIQEEIKRTLIEQEMSSCYKTTKITKIPCFSFILDGGIRVFVEKDYGMWQVTVCRNWESPRNPGELLLDRRAFNLDEHYKTLKWSSKVIEKAAELIVEAIA